MTTPIYRVPDTSLHSPLQVLTGTSGRRLAVVSRLRGSEVGCFWLHFSKPRRPGANKNHTWGPRATAKERVLEVARREGQTGREGEEPESIEDRETRNC